MFPLAIMIKEIHAKTILNHVKQPEPYFGLKYNLNMYRGCQHQCIYCDSRSECYQIENFADILVKSNAIELLADALPRKRVRGTIGFGSMNDAYMTVERKYRLTRRALEVAAEHRFPVHIITKSDLVRRDKDLLGEINQVYAAVSFSITTADDDLAKIVEPGAPPSSARFEALRDLSQAGILTGVTMMPILPFIEDTVENITQLVERAHQAGAAYILPWFGMSLRAGSRDYYYRQLDRYFPGVKERYVRQYGGRYECNSPNWRELEAVFRAQVQKYGIATQMPVFTPQKITKKNQQMKLF
ncbi:MAG: radical SAM protein [Anaerolineales bacterium]|nr:radical SAM protein [Anaerolineales bacterium]